MYCGSCLHDNTLAGALMRAGHDVALIPTYTPMRTDEADVSNKPIHYGAINVYLQQKWRLFERSPALLDRLLDRPALLRWVSRFAASTDARELGALTLSILRGEAGHQRKELERLVEFVGSLQPDIVQLTNAMFLGIGAQLRRRLNVPVVSGLTGEDLFLEELSEPYRSQVREEMVKRAREVDGFVATSRYYAELMQTFLEVDATKMHVAPLGINVEDFESRAPSASERDPVTLGYLARICPEKGLHLLLEAFRILRQSERHSRLRVKVAGYLGERDRAYFERQRQALRDWGLSEAVQLQGEVDRREKLAFLQSVDLLSVPTIYREPKGLFVLEGWAAGIPVVQPRHGAFPELLEVGGGLLVEPHSAAALADGLQALIEDPDRRAELGRQGRRAVETEFHADTMAARTLAIYERIIVSGATR